METHRDCFDLLDHDVTARILDCLNDPGDIVRASAVSRSWREFIISNGLSKQFCLRIFPQLSHVSSVVDTEDAAEGPPAVGCSNDWGHAVTQHRAFASLARHLTSFEPVSCISKAISASSTDNYPEESVRNTLYERDRIGRRASYWSSSGQSDPSVPERLTYKLFSNFCVISEVNIQAFQAYFQPNFPIYSAKGVRFRMGHRKVTADSGLELLDTNEKQSTDDNFVWTYTSPEFPMTQGNDLQRFKLPEPVLCIGGFFRLELLGRVQRQEMDGLFYICVTHVQVLGRSLTPLFQVDAIDSSGGFVLMYNHQAQFFQHPSAEERDEANSSPGQPPHRRVRGWEQILNILRGNMGVEVFLSDDEHHESEEEDDGFFEDFAD